MFSCVLFIKFYWVLCLIIKNQCSKSQILHKTPNFHQKNHHFNLHFVSIIEHEGELFCCQVVYLWLTHWAVVYVHACRRLYMHLNVSICLCPGRFTVQLMGPQPSRGGAAGGNCRCWSSWGAVRRPGAPRHPGIERGPELLSVEHLPGWAAEIHQSRTLTSNAVLLV